MCEGEQVSRRVIRLEIPVFPDRRMFRVHDATVDPDAPGGPLAPTGALISANREQMWVASLQEHIGVRVFLEEWDTAPPPFGDGWEDEAKAVVYLRGALRVDMGSAGRAVEGRRLVGGVGDYGIRVQSGTRREVMRPYSELSERGVAPLGDEV